MLEAFELSKEVKLCDEVELCDDIEFNLVNRDFWTTDDGSGGLLYMSALQGLLLTRPQGWVCLFWEGLKSYLKTLDYLAVYHLPGSHFIFLSFKIE